MSTKPSWDSFFDQKSKLDSEFLQDRPSVIEERFCMDGEIQFDGENHFVEIPQELLDRAEIKAGDPPPLSRFRGKAFLRGML